ncbi:MULTISPECIES: pitrilysin family protein [unclassified Arcicella]|uniref:M16 family metallopeptidase n=1 Tax=unclassified Arcicella TaxID=2644986 RepID=UPI00286654D6|nr:MULTISPECIES: pitrilysin family protein [unclassified Arcicella]MDR6560283.1 putative Zn-dependent peptidase [Arcicella sp. BE51]MDR6810111.1 putative Zn-dependent peptidase [Arcicella sp. BE140]MDR6821460.1 putative Zn-dependent peptidase [Arcicella sp. BE139]
MISYDYFILDNGLKVYVHQDYSTPIAAVNIIYNVGSRDEEEHKTGFAHLFEHLMFGGSKNIPSYDTPLQKVGGENNAFTSPDITNYYITLPAVNIETAFWLESDRMLSLSFDQKVLDVQQKVVIEEFKQRYLNQPYGDVWLKLRPLAYQVHPYKWATIGKEIAHIENAVMDDVRNFFYKHYLPNNAILVVAGPLSVEEVKQLAKKWFEPIPAGNVIPRNLPKEPIQTSARFLEVEAKVPLDAIYKIYHTQGRHDVGYNAVDLTSDILGRSKSSRLYDKLVKEQSIFNSINAYVSSSLDPGLMVLQGNLNKGISIEEGDAAIQDVLDDFLKNPVSEEELTKVKNQAESTLVFSEVELLNRAMNLAFAANAGNVEYANEESSKIQAVTVDDISAQAKSILTKENCSTMYYRAS